MNRKEAAELLPIIKAFCEGKQIQFLFDEWRDIDEIGIREFSENPELYRIKPESTYRPFKDAEECWNEMQKHQPIGVVKDKYFANYQTHRAFTCLTTKGCYFRGYEDDTFESSFKNLLFADGTPFGVKVEK